jgi:hypothetical protein
MQTKTLKHTEKKYLFFISQDYSFPVLRPLQNAIWSKGDNVKWFMYGDEIHKEYILPNETVLNNVTEIIDYKPDAVFVPGNVVPSFIPGLKIEVFHGLPGGKSKKNGEIYHYIIRGMFDLYCTQGPSSTKPFKVLEKKYQHFTVHETGWCKLDPLFPLIKKEKTSRKKSIFFASTFSPRYSKAKILYPFLVKMMTKYDYDWYITLHPKMNKETVLLYKSIDLENVHLIETTQLMPVMKKSDMMLCDISSIVYEYLTQLKPVVTFQSPQNSDSIININNLKDLEQTIVGILNETLHISQEKIKNEVSHFHPYQDGRASHRILNRVEKMLNGELLPSKLKPYNIIRNIKLRKALNYWKF